MTWIEAVKRWGGLDLDNAMSALLSRGEVLPNPYITSAPPKASFLDLFREAWGRKPLEAFELWVKYASYVKATPTAQYQIKYANRVYLEWLVFPLCARNLNINVFNPAYYSTKAVDSMALSLVHPVIREVIMIVGWENLSFSDIVNSLKVSDIVLSAVCRHYAYAWHVCKGFIQPTIHIAYEVKMKQMEKPHSGSGA